MPVLALCLLLATAAGAAAQAPSEVSGRVFDAASGLPVEAAELLLGDLRAGSGPDGRFRFALVPAGHHELRVRRLGYSPWRITVDVSPGLPRELAIPLTVVAVRLDSLTVVAEAPGRISIDGASLVRRGPDLARALDGWEGVVIRRTGGGGPAAPQIRGGAPDEMLVLVDGFALNDPLTGRADLSTIASGQVERVTLVPGVHTTRAGSRAVAGVLVVETSRTPRPEASLWYGSHDARGARLAGAAGPLDLTLTGERYPSAFSYDVPEVRGGGRAARANAGGEQYGASARLESPVRLHFRATGSSRGLPGTTTNPTRSAHATDRAALLGIQAGTRLRLQGSLQWLESRVEDPAPPTGTAYDAYTHGVGGSATVEYGQAVSVAGWGGRISAAAEGRGDRFGGDGVRPGSSFTQGSLRTSAALQRGDRIVWSLSPALRLDAWTGSTTPRASLRIDGGVRRGGTSATASLGGGVTAPVLADLLFREGVGVRLNPDLRPERVPWELEAGVRHELAGGRGAAAIRAFYGRVEDMIVWGPDFRFIWSPQNFDVRRRGGELTLQVRPHESLRLEGSASYAAVTYDRKGGAQVQYRPRVTYAASAGWMPGRWTVDLRWRRIGRRFPNAAGTNPRPPISLLDLSIEREVTSSITARAEARDVADARAEFIAGYPTPGRTVTLYLELTLP